MKKLLYILLIINCSSLIVNSQSPTQEWASRYERPASSGAFNNFIGIDKLGNTYVLGQIFDPVTLFDIVLIKYNSTGDTVWARIYNNPFNNDDIPEGLSVDSLGNAYIAATMGAGPSRITTIRYNPSGVLQWAAVYTGPGNLSCGANDLEIDNIGNTYVTGTVPSLGSALTIKYNTSGDTVWTRLKSQSGFSHFGQFISLDNSNNIYTAITKVNTSTNLDLFLVVKYNSVGSEQWTAVHDNNSGFNSLGGLAIDNAGNSFIGANTLSGFTTIKFTPAGAEQWFRAYTNGISEQVRSITTDAAGNCYVTGRSTMSAGNSDFLTIKYLSNGDSAWIRRYNGPSNSSDGAYGIALDDSVNVYVTGASIGISTNYDYATVKYNANGFQQWVARYNGQLGNGEDNAYAIAVDKNRNVYVTGVSDRGGILFDYVTVKYSQFVGINPVSNEVPEEFMLYQNYPNPFNPITNFGFRIANFGLVSLKIYDVTGKEIAVLINEELNTGEYKTDWDASGFSSGVYFYQLTITNEQFTKEVYRDTKKMILLK